MEESENDFVKKIEEHAGLFFSPEEICLILGMDITKSQEDFFVKAYKKGKLIKEAALRKSIIDLATSGSSPAQMLAMDIMNKSKSNSIPT